MNDPTAGLAFDEPEYDAADIFGTLRPLVQLPDDYKPKAGDELALGMTTVKVVWVDRDYVGYEELSERGKEFSPIQKSVDDFVQHCRKKKLLLRKLNKQGEVREHE